MQKPIQRVKFTKAIARHAKNRDQNPSLGMICSGEPHQRSPNAPKFEDLSQEETDWQEQGAREAAWKLGLGHRSTLSGFRAHHRLVEDSVPILPTIHCSPSIVQTCCTCPPQMANIALVTRSRWVRLSDQRLSISSGSRCTKIKFLANEPFRGVGVALSSMH